MSTITTKKISTKNHSDFTFNVERFDGAMEVDVKSRQRENTSSRFHDYRKNGLNDKPEWYGGVSSLDEALDLMRNGYQPVVDDLKASAKLKGCGTEKRITFENRIEGFAPVVPLAMMGVPNSMISTTIKPIKKKVLDIYYDMTASSGTRKETFIERGKTLLGAIVALERRGYRFNLYAIQSYTDIHDSDVMIVKIKSSDKPLDLRRMSFPMMHPAFFRVIGFDWCGRFPKGRYRSGYGHALAHEFDRDGELQDAMKQLLGANAIYVQGAKDYSQDEIKEVLTCKE